MFFERSSKLFDSADARNFFKAFEISCPRPKLCSVFSFQHRSVIETFSRSLDSHSSLERGDNLIKLVFGPFILELFKQFSLTF